MTSGGGNKIPGLLLERLRDTAGHLMRCNASLANRAHASQANVNVTHARRAWGFRPSVESTGRVPAGTDGSKIVLVRWGFLCSDLVAARRWFDDRRISTSQFLTEQAARGQQKALLKVSIPS